MAAGTEGSSELILDKKYSLVDNSPITSTENSYVVEYANTAYTVYFTKLPVVTITTKYAIVDAPSVYATFTMSEANGTITSSNLGIEVRGGNSQNYPKKSYELSFWADTVGNTNRDMQLLGMRTDNKWNMQALFNEPMRANSKVANELWQEMSQLYYKDKEPAAKNGIAMAYVELFVNDEYKGIYTIGERIDKKQLKLKKYTNTIKGELYKGAYWDGAVLFTSLPDFDNNSPNWGGFEYKHPEEYTDWKNLYDFVRFVEKSSDADFVKQYQGKFDLQNAVDYYIFMNVLRATDNYGKNLYIAKYNAGEPYFYVPWDLDGVFGNNWMGLNDNTTNDIVTNGFYKRLNQDCSPSGFRSVLARRWAELRTTILTSDYIMAKFVANNTYLRTNGVYQREHAVWSGYNYDDKQLAYTADWLTRRLDYLDGVFSQQCALLSAAPSKQAPPAVQCYPNPANDYLTIEARAATYEISIQDVSGRVALQTTARTPVSRLDISRMPKGLYLVLVKGENFVATEKLVRN
ncbi:CotH kinase family protein [Hymenobacter setariae]|uniref:CotH kinase family protein n=1 Tax=Hymenobacter setariae TaxID=2594794 RepID=UPI001F48C14D|nr:CotH kinase family protein [Hymenobacter setariae]